VYWVCSIFLLFCYLDNFSCFICICLSILYFDIELFGVGCSSLVSAVRVVQLFKLAFPMSFNLHRSLDNLSITNIREVSKALNFIFVSSSSKWANMAALAQCPSVVLASFYFLRLSFNFTPAFCPQNGGLSRASLRDLKQAASCAGADARPQMLLLPLILQYHLSDGNPPGPITTKSALVL
jgi:hypothetical protein